ncbi:UNVERIFIED_CONTAM: hypothetical protein Sangu_2104700 [Sesamum angustifolium]|uniref:Late embryogenesis abundant protein n=1 Tax=Sesamum angustifolium TaxID=2727405 RepID=A0AAW2LJS1_9LAMI
MAKTLNTLFTLRRAYAVAAENVRVTSPVSIIKKVGDSGKETKEMGKEVFWMRDPKTGNWIPETHFGEVDVVELREKLLSKKPNF